MGPFKLEEDIETAQKPLNKDEAELLQLATNCARTSSDLQKELDKLKAGGRRAMVKKFFSSQEKPQYYNDGLQADLLVRLNISSRAKEAQRVEKFETLDSQLQQFIVDAAQIT